MPKRDFISFIRNWLNNKKKFFFHDNKNSRVAILGTWVAFIFFILLSNKKSQVGPGRFKIWLDVYRHHIYILIYAQPMGGTSSTFI